MRFSIGKVAKTFGFTKEALRYYDRTGVLPSFRDESGYRYYEDSQLQYMATVKKLQNIGFSLQEIHGIRSGQYTEEGLISRLESAVDERAAELRYQETLLRKLRQDVAGLKDPSLYDRPRLVEAPERWAFYFDNTDRMVNDPELRADMIRWYGRMYPAEGLETMPFDEMHRSFSRRIGLMISAGDAGACGFPQTKNITVFPAGRAVELSTKYHGKPDFFEWIHGVLEEFAAQKGLHYQENVHMIYKFSYREEDGVLTIYLTVSAPVKEDI